MYSYKVNEKEIYGVKCKPTVVEIPKAFYLTIEGEGSPASDEFASRIQTLYQISYGVRMIYKDENYKGEYFPYTVFPLEGFWDLTEEGRKKSSEFIDKNELVYKLMIKQPSFLTPDLLNYVIDKVKKKGNNDLIDKVKFEEINEGKSLQMLHIGPFDEEHKTFEIMKEYIKENNLELKTLVHKEIYLSDFRKTDESKLKTILRYKLV